MGNRASSEDKRRLKEAAKKKEATAAAPTKGEEAAGSASTATTLTIDNNEKPEATATKKETKPNRFHRHGQRPFVLGHRGAPLFVQENTYASFEKAIEMGFDGIELDVCVTKDNVAVIFHDEDTMRLTGQPGTIYDRTYAEVQQLRIQKTIDVDTKGRMITFEKEQPIPTLLEVLKLAKSKGVVVDIDTHVIKLHWDRRHWGTLIGQAVREADIEDSVMMSGFDFFMLEAGKEENPQMTTCYTYDDDLVRNEPFLSNLDQVPDEWWQRHPTVSANGIKPANISDACGLLRTMMNSHLIGDYIGASASLFEWTVLDGDTIEKYHKINYAVGTYTLFPLDTSSVHHFMNEEQTETVIGNLLGRKIDWIETDNPLKVREIIDKYYAEIKEPEDKANVETKEVQAA